MKKILFIVFFIGGCGPDLEEKIDIYTSDVRQDELCRTSAEADEEEAPVEDCLREKITQRLRVTLSVDAFDRATLYGVPRDGALDRAIYGTKDTLGGYLFEDFRTVSSDISGCTLTDSIVLSLREQDEADKVENKSCVALVGRETRTTTISIECDETNDPPQENTRVVRKRWERAIGCGE